MNAHHSFDIDLAAKLGSVELAILIHHFQHWIKYNIRLKRNFKEGRTWTYQTREEIAAHFPYFSPSQVRRLTDKLVKMGVLRKGNFNKSSIDKTLWYSFENEEMFTIGKFANSIDDSVKWIDDSVKAIPHSKPNSKTTYGKDLGPKTEACDKSQVKTSDFARRWKMTEAQAESFEWLKSKSIDAPDEKLIYWAKNFTFQRLIDVYNEAIHNKPRSMKNYMAHILDNKKTVHNARIQANLEFAKDFCEIHRWNDVRFFKKYIRFKIGEYSEELPLDMDINQFIMTFTAKFESTQHRSTA